MIRPVAFGARPDGGIEELFFSDCWQDMPGVRHVVAAFAILVYKGRFVIVRVDSDKIEGGRLCLPGGSTERGKDKSIEAIIRRECREEAWAKLGKVRPLGFARWLTRNGYPCFVAYCIAEVVTLDENFQPTTESDERYEVPMNDCHPLLQKLGGAHEDHDWVQRRSCALVREAIERVARQAA